MFILLYYFKFIIFFHEEGMTNELFGHDQYALFNVLQICYLRLGRHLEKDVRKCLQVGLRWENASADEQEHILITASAQY